jgi:nitrate reductase gamma subunit
MTLAREILSGPMPDTGTRTVGATRIPLDRHGVAWGLLAVAGVLLLTYFGSDRLLWFDAALAGYLVGVVFFVFAVVYRYVVWVRRPPTRMLNRRGWETFRMRTLPNLVRLPVLVVNKLLAQVFIWRRSRSRWLAHQLVFWGALLAAAVTFPLTLGLLHFQSVGQEVDRWRVFAVRVGTVEFEIGSIWSWLAFNALNISAVLVLAGVFIFLHRRLRDAGALAVERSADFLVLAGLFAVSITGLSLTVSSRYLEGQFYAALNTVHALTVILGLMYIPFSKLFHIFQRPANLGVEYYRRANEADEPARCARCGEEYAARRHVNDLETVLDELGFDYRLDNEAGQPLAEESDNYQQTCPRCRRVQVALAQSARVGGFG